MEHDIIKLWESSKAKLVESFAKDLPGSYQDIFARLMQHMHDAAETVLDDYDPRPDPKRVTTIDHGDYQGSMLFIVFETGYQPSVYWRCMVSYGSCSGCDAFEAVMDDEGQQRLDGLMTLALHMVQAMKREGGR